MKLAALIFGILLIAQIPTQSKSDGREIEYKRGVVHSGSLYIQAPSEPDRDGQLLRINLDNPTRVERIKFRVSESARLSSLMKISGKDIYLSSIHDSGGGQIVAQIDKYTLDDLVVTSDGLLVPSIDKLPSYTISPLRQVITVAPLNDAFFLSTKHADRDMTPEQVHLGTPVKLKLWYDLVVGTDGFLYLYILEEKKLTVWKRDGQSMQDKWEKHFKTEEIAPGPFSVIGDGDIAYISSAGGKVYQFSGGKLSSVGDPSTPQADAAGADSDGRTVLYIEDLDTGGNWRVTLDRAFNVPAQANFLKDGAFEAATYLPGNLADGLRQILQAAKRQ
jgi:hypothetical protein